MTTNIAEIVTSDLSKFGACERKMAEELLRSWRTQGLPENFFDEDVTIAMNTNSGCVFLTNSEYQSAMMNGDKLEIWHNCPQCDHEGFIEDMFHGEDNKNCQQYCDEIGAVA